MSIIHQSTKPDSAPAEVFSVRDPEAVQALVHPLRLQILEALREPASAAAVARRIGQPRQLVNYHLKTLERAGLAERVGERRTGNFIESVYRAVARSFVVSPEVAWSDPCRLEALRRQHSLQTLVLLGDNLQRDAVALLDRAAFDGEEVASASVSAEVHFDSEEDRVEFLNAYLKAVGPLFEKYGARHGAPYRVILAAYPATEGEEKQR